MGVATCTVPVRDSPSLKVTTASAAKPPFAPMAAASCGFVSSEPVAGFVAPTFSQRRTSVVGTLVAKAVAVGEAVGVRVGEAVRVRVGVVGVVGVVVAVVVLLVLVCASASSFCLW